MLIEIHGTATLATGSEEAPALSSQSLLCAAPLFSWSAGKGSRRFMQAGQTAVLNTDLRFLDAKQVENGQWTLVKS